MKSALVLALALVIDVAFGEPPNPFHPVAWIGALYRYGRARLLRDARAGVLVARGGVLTIGVGALAASVAAAVAWAMRDQGIAGVLVEAAVLKTSFSLRALAGAAHQVARALERGDLPAARDAVGVHLVSRPTAGLDAPHVASAAVESVAENLTDSIVAPAFFFLVCGLPGAFAYRAINTADAMIGYREGALEHLGKVAARLDDVVNVVPARMAALALVVAAGLIGRDARRALRTMWRDHRTTESPNAGWTMAAMAGALGVSLEKPGAYRIGVGRFPDADDIETAIKAMVTAAAISLLVLSAARALGVDA